MVIGPTSAASSTSTSSQQQQPNNANTNANLTVTAVMTLPSLLSSSSSSSMPLTLTGADIAADRFASLLLHLSTIAGMPRAALDAIEAAEPNRWLERTPPKPPTLPTGRPQRSTSATATQLLQQPNGNNSSVNSGNSSVVNSPVNAAALGRQKARNKANAIQSMDDITTPSGTVIIIVGIIIVLLMYYFVDNMNRSK
jgi:hypothetical protein